MGKKNIVCAVIFLLFQHNYEIAFAQTNSPCYNKELSGVNDNDLYAAKGTDRYYTNGFFFKYSYTRQNTKEKILKKLHHWEIGQRIYIAQRREIHTYQMQDIDRPIAGYLFAKFSNTKFYSANTVLEYGISIGTVGPSAYAKNLQGFYHRQINVNSAHWNWIWDYQIKNEVGVNLHSAYAFRLLKNEINRFIKLTPITNATLGSSFTNVTGTLALQVGRFNKMHESIFWDAAIGNNLRTEFFFFYKPALMYQLYNVTIQGGMFRKDKGPFLSQIEPFVFTHELGMMYGKKRYTAAAHVFYQGKEAKSQLHNHAYGRLALAYRFN